MKTRTHCRICKDPIKGRSDKMYCSDKCKSKYHRLMREHNSQAISGINRILSRNRSILLEVMGKNRSQIKVSTLVLEKRKFNFNYITKYTVNSKGKTYNHVYDFAWMNFSSDETLIIRKR